MPQAAKAPTKPARSPRDKTSQKSAKKKGDLAATASHDFEAVPQAKEAIDAMGDFLAGLHAGHQTLRLCLRPIALSAAQMVENMRDAGEREIMDMIEAGAWVTEQGKRLHSLADFCNSAGARMFVVAARLAMAQGVQS